MKHTLKRAITAGILALGITAGSIAVAAPASAAPKFDTFKETITVGSHTDTLIYTPATKKEFKALGSDSGRATAYNITLKHGKKVLLNKKHVNTWKVLYVDIKVYNFSNNTYKNDKILTKKLRSLANASTTHAKKWVKKYLKSETPPADAKSKTQACVNSTVTTVQVTIIEGNDVPVGRTECEDGIYVITALTGDEYGNFTVTGYNEDINLKYTYDSTTGVFTAGVIN